MSSRKFRFVSPGVFLKEIDNSQIPGIREALGPVIIGKTTKGPALKPVKVSSLEELEIIFGQTPSGASLDPWREGSSILSDSHAMHAARAYLTAGDGTSSPVTIIRLLGIAGDDAAPDGSGEPGWKSNNAYGLFLVEDPAANVAAGSTLQADLAAIFYGQEDTFGVKLKGTDSTTGAATDGVSGSVVQFGTNNQIEVLLSASSGTTTKKTLFKNIRKDFNTNPVATNLNVSNVITGTLSDKYWLGETFEQTFDKFEAGLKTDGKRAAVIVKLVGGEGGMSDFQSPKHAATAARSGWVFGQDTTNNNTDFSVDNQQKLFRIIALHEGQQSSKELIVGIEDIKIPREGSLEEYGNFTVVVRQINRTGLSDLERFSNCNLDPSSENFIARRIGDQFVEWNTREKRNKHYGEYPSRSDYIRVDMDSDVANGQLKTKSQVPFGFYGPVRPASITGTVKLTGADFATGEIIIKAATISGGAAAGGINGNTITIKTIDTGAGLAFALDSGKTPAVAAARNAVGAADENAPKIGTDGVTTVASLAAAIKQCIEASKITGEITIGAVEAVGDGTHKFKITQAKRGALADTITSNANGIYQAITNTGGANGSADTEHLEPATSAWVTGNVKVRNLAAAHSTLSLNWPSMPLINTASVENNYFMGVSPYTLSYAAHENGAADGSSVYAGYVDFLRRMSTYRTSRYVSDQDSGFVTANETAYSFKFTLDDVVLIPRPGLSGTDATLTASIAGAGDITTVSYVPGSKNKAAGIREKSYSSHVSDGLAGTSLRTLLDIVQGFHMPLDGGHDGLDVTESDPFNERVLAGNSTAASYAFASVDRAIELIKDPEAIEHNLAAMPGISNAVLTTKLVDHCEARADSLAIIDLPDIYVPPSQRKYDTFQQRIVTTPEQASQALVERQLNSSYGAAYYPWVKIKDSSRNRDLWSPPSVVALGVMANTERSSEVWFAPAGFNRGGLNQGNAGVPVVGVTEQLLSRDRDTLYQSNINPIASFVSEGIVIFGQKTLQSTQSALDRINVRRLLIFVKKEVSRISKNLLFEQNVQATWTRFHGQVRPFLESVKVRFGLTDFKVVLDNTTTTPDLVDRNIMYAKIFLKPARSIEFIAVDFVITRSGASFADPLE